MTVFISHQSALEYWRTHRALPHSNTQQRCRVTLPQNPPTTEQTKLTGLSLPLHILLREPNNRWASKTMRQHAFTGKTPEGCFMSTEEGLFVSSPEFCFLQLSGQMTLHRLIELGYELCGSYSMPAPGDSNVPERGFHLRQPLTSTKKLAVFAARMPGSSGHKKAMRALRYLLDGSASPMETKLSILLTLPYKLGGYGLIRPKLNSRINPSRIAILSSGKEYYVCDLFWPDHDLAVEYDSELFHTGLTHITADSKKRNALTMMGVTIITVTKQQLYSSMEFDKVARALANRLRKRLVFKNPDFAVAQRELRKQLLY